jgi:hypothetical protein
VLLLISEEGGKGVFRSEAIKKSREGDVARANIYMPKPADLTGGRRFQVADVLNLENLEKTLAQVVNELRRQYGSGHYPKETDKNGELRMVKSRDSCFINSTNITRRKQLINNGLSNN